MPGLRTTTLCGERLDSSAHICAFFGSPREKYDTLAPFFREGLEQGERIVNIIDDAERPRHIEELETAGVPVSSAISKRQMRVLTPEETYLRQGDFELHDMFTLVLDALSAAKKDGTAIRTCGEMSWMRRSSVPPEQVMEYEARMNLLTPTYDCTLMCVYDMAHLDGYLIADIFATHPFVILNGRVRENPHYVPPDTYLNELLRSRVNREATQELRPS